MSDSESKGEEDEFSLGLAYCYHVASVIGDSVLNSTLPCSCRDSPIYFRMMATAYVAGIDRENVGYIYNQLYMYVYPPHDAEYILIQRDIFCSRDRLMNQIGPILGINSREGLYHNEEGAERERI